MSSFPREARSAVTKCIDCNAPVVRTVDGRFVCVDCGESPIRPEGGVTDASGGARPTNADG